MGVRNEYNLIIGEKSAEKIKINLSELVSSEQLNDLVRQILK